MGLKGTKPRAAEAPRRGANRKLGRGRRLLLKPGRGEARAEPPRHGASSARAAQGHRGTELQGRRARSRGPPWRFSMKPPRRLAAGVRGGERRQPPAVGARAA
jgi:hypothetical protein